MRARVLVLLGFALAASPAAAQAPAPIELDGSFGTSGAVLPDATSDYRIDESAGRRSEGNLFHSFARFSVPFRSSATFTGDPSIERVLARVTGSSISQIDGTLRSTIDGADLYLMNPRGVVFSGTASLDLRGSFYVSSANGLRFEDGSVFPATQSAEPLVLSSAAPSAWGFTSAAPGTIRFTQVRNFGVPRGENLEAVGGSVFVSGFSPTTTLLAPGGVIALASRSSIGEVPVDVAALAARNEAAGVLGTVSIGTNAVLDVSDASGLAPSRGRIVIRGGALTVDRSTLRADSARDAVGDTPDIDLETTRSILLRSSNPALATTHIEVAARANARGGGLRLSSEEITLSGRASAGTTASGTARAGSLDLGAGSLQLSEASSLATNATGDATTGRLAVSARTIGLAGAAQIRSLNEASTAASEVSITAEKLLKIESSASMATQATAAGNGALLRIGAETLDQATGARIESGTTGMGEGGDVEIRAGIVTLRGAALGADPGGVFASSTGARAAGAIFIAGDEVSVEGGAQVSATAQSNGDGGDVEIRARRKVLLSGSSAAGPSGLFARSGLRPGTPAQGNGGSILVVAPSVDVGNGAEISAQTFGTGTAGGIEIVATDRVGIAGGATARSSINAKAASGPGGNIVIETGELRIDDGGEVTASTLDSGDSGDIEIEAQRVYVGGGAASSLGPAGIFAQSIPGADTGIDGGDGGDIEIRASSLLELQSAGVISVKTFGTGDAGSILVVAPVVNVADGGAMSAQTFSAGTAGEIRILAADSVKIAGSATARSSINAQAARGDGGDIVIETGELRVDGGGEISASTLNSGKSGDIKIEAQRVYVGGGAASAAGPAGILAQSIPTEDTGIHAGAGGDIEIRASSLLELRNSGAISVKTRGTGAAGAVTIRNAEFVRVEGGEISARGEGSGAAGSVTLDSVGTLLVGQGGSITTETLSAGLGGSIDIAADQQVRVANGGRISASSEGTGDAGSILIDGGWRFTARDGGQVTTEAKEAFGGNIQIVADHLIYLRRGEITTDVKAGMGNGGNISIDPKFVVLNQGGVIASAVVGNGGNIAIDTQYFLAGQSRVVASSELGIDGEIQISAPAVDLSSELAQLDTPFLDASSKLAAACAARAGERGTFAVRGRARPASPDAPLGAPDEALRAEGCEEPRP